ncbi:MAG: hypothetical protein MJD61_07020 [Proteobacteria bacterium]|nr:hypothetical protein [Pseudomonadota bacterium]
MNRLTKPTKRSRLPLDAPFPGQPSWTVRIAIEGALNALKDAQDLDHAYEEVRKHARDTRAGLVKALGAAGALQAPPPPPFPFCADSWERHRQDVWREVKAARDDLEQIAKRVLAAMEGAYGHVQRSRGRPSEPQIDIAVLVLDQCGYSPSEIENELNSILRQKTTAESVRSRLGRVRKNLDTSQ